MTCKLVAELSANHLGSLERAIAIVTAAAGAGAHAVKLQTWHPERMVLDKDYTMQSGPWAGQKLADLYAQAFTPWEWHKPIFNHAKTLGIEAFSSVFDYPSLDFLESLGCPRYKIASFEIVDLPLIRRVAKTGKPMILSTGMAFLSDVEEAVVTAREGGCKDLMILKCTSAYPATARDANLLAMQHMKVKFGGTHIGLSDHSPGIGVACAAAALGATMIEKHLTLRRSDGGPDAGFSMEPEEFAMLCTEVRRAEESIGTATYSPLPSERPQLELRRSLYFARDMKVGETPGITGLQSARPALGLHTRLMHRCSTIRLAKDVRRGDPATWECFEAKPGVSA